MKETSSKGQTFPDVSAIVICAVVWGTSWHAVTLQLGLVDPMVSLVYRFSIACALLFLWCAVRGETIMLSSQQHQAALGVGFFTFTIDYTFTYLAVAHVASAVVALIFAALAFANLVVFRLALGHRSPRTAWAAAAVGTLGVGLVSWNEIVQAKMDARARVGVVFALTAVLAATLGNVFAHRGEKAGAPLAASMAWAMGYGTILLAIYASATGHTWTFDVSRFYVLSLLYLALMGSAVTFLLYFGLARRRGYTAATYIQAITPLLAMVMSSQFEGKRWNAMAIGGTALILGGQWLLLRTRAS